MELTSYARGRRSFSRLTSSKFVPDVLKSFLLLLTFILKETSNRDKLRFSEQEAAGSNHSRINTLAVLKYNMGESAAFVITSSNG